MSFIQRLTALTGVLLLCGAAQAQVSYEEHIRPVWERNCSACHGERSPSYAEFEANEEHYEQLMTGPRMASYAEMLQFVVWPDTGALMRRLDDGSSKQEAGKRLSRKERRARKDAPASEPGSMYEYLGVDEAERQRNLTLFKAWVGNDAWSLKRWDKWTKAELDRIQARP